jgi:hypothetical protein
MARVATVFFANILTFAGLYYLFALEGDRNDAVVRHIYYRGYEISNAWHREHYRSDLPPCKNIRAFNGISERLFSGVDWGGESDFLERNWAAPSTGYMVERAKQPLEEVVRFLPEERLPVFLGCLHFSITTAATVGYGDIAPNNLSTRLTADLQIALNVILVIFILGMLFSGWL